MFQSQTTETLIHCTLCEFMTRSKSEFEEHSACHPSCGNCKRQFVSSSDLDIHVIEDHQADKKRCDICEEEVPICEFEKHCSEHERFSSFKKGLEKGNTNASKKSKGKTSGEYKKKPLNTVSFSNTSNL